MASNNPYYVAPPNLNNALQQLMGGYEFTSGIRNDARQRDARSAAEQDLLEGKTESALARLIGAGAVKEANALAQYQAGANSVYGTPIYGTMNGQTAVGSFDKRGQFRQINTGGFVPTPGVKTVDTGTGTVIIDSRSGAPVGGASPGQGAPAPQSRPQTPAGYIPKDVQGEAQQRKFGTEVGEKQAGLGQAKASLDSSVNSLDRMAFEADRIAKDPNLKRITGLWGVFPNMPGGGAANVNAKLETLKSQVAFGVLQAMREASKTGGALGAVSDRENQMLTSALAALDRAQSEGEFRSAMKQIAEYTKGAKQRLQQAYDTDYGSISKPQAPQATQPAQQQNSGGALAPGRVVSGFRFKGGNPNDQSSWEPVR